MWAASESSRERDALTILVTGSAGHLGEALIRTLRGQGRPAIGLDIQPSNFTDCVGSMGDRELVRRCLAGVRTVIHSAALHKPHIATHGDQDFIDTNITATRVLLEEGVSAGLSSFVFTSTTSAFGSALTPGPDEPAVWVTEDVLPIARNIYGETKFRAESLCELFFRRHRLPVIVLRTSRFFPEADDDAGVRAGYSIENVQANEFLHRRVDLEDVVTAHRFRTLHRLGDDAVRPRGSDGAATRCRQRRPPPVSRLRATLCEPRVEAFPHARPRLCQSSGRGSAQMAAEIRFPSCSQLPARGAGLPQSAGTRRGLQGISRGPVQGRAIPRLSVSLLDFLRNHGVTQST